MHAEVNSPLQESGLNILYFYGVALGQCIETVGDLEAEVMFMLQDLKKVKGSTEMNHDPANTMYMKDLFQWLESTTPGNSYKPYSTIHFYIVCSKWVALCARYTQKLAQLALPLKAWGWNMFFYAFVQSLLLRVLQRQLCCLYYNSFVHFYQINASLRNKILKKKILLTPDFQIAFERLLSNFAQYARYIKIVLIHPNQSNQTVCKLWATSKGDFSSTVLMML